MGPARLKNVPITGTSERKRQSVPQPQVIPVQDNGHSKKMTMDGQTNGSTSNQSSVTELKSVTGYFEDHDVAGAVVQKSNLLLKLSDKPSIYLSILLGMQVCVCERVNPIASPLGILFLITFSLINEHSNHTNNT